MGNDLPPNEHWPTSETASTLHVSERARILESGIEELSAAEIEDVDTFLARLDERGIEFESVGELVEQLHLEYTETDSERRGFLEIVAAVAGAYAALVDAGFEARALELVFFEPNGAAIGVVEAAIAFSEGTLSAAEYGELVAGTSESIGEPPEPDVSPEE